MEKCRPTIDEQNLELKSRFYQRLVAESLLQTVLYRISCPKCYKVYLRKLHIVLDSADVSVSLHLKSTQHPLIQKDIEFCEKVLLHLVQKLQQRHYFPHSYKRKRVSRKGLQGALASLDTKHVST